MQDLWGWLRTLPPVENTLHFSTYTSLTDPKLCKYWFSSAQVWSQTICAAKKTQIWLHPLHKTDKLVRHMIFETKRSEGPAKFLKPVALTRPCDAWWNPSVPRASWKTYQPLTIAPDKHIGTRVKKESWLLPLHHYIFHDPHFIGSFFKPSVSFLTFLFSLICAVYFCSSALSSRSLGEYMCSKIVSRF